MFWSSDDGAAWTSLAWSGLPATAPVDELFGVSDGWAIRGTLSDRAAMWHSSDGARWTQTWSGPGPSGMEYTALGPIFKAPGGGFLSFGGVATAPGGPAAVPNDIQVWTSSDQLHWVKTSRVPRPGWSHSFATGPGGYVAAGQTVVGQSGEAGYGQVGIWTSQDGRTWKPVAGLPTSPSVQVVSVVGDGTQVVVTCVDDQGNVSLLVGDGQQQP
jgi:hypothetical protein